MQYTINGKNYNVDSNINQEIKSKFVDREVRACVTDMMTDLINYSMECYDNWEDGLTNLFFDACPDCEGRCRETTEEDISAIAEYCQQESLPFTPDDLDAWYVCEDCGKVCLRDESVIRRTKVYEYYIVSSWLGEKLQRHGEVVMDRSGGWIWGRQTSGQAILLDEVISNICQELEILEGQRNSWEKEVRAPFNTFTDLEG